MSLKNDTISYSYHVHVVCLCWIGLSVECPLVEDEGAPFN